ncbi:hypothetical protein B0H21DRAFT_882382 [Amylocystis lapponica]|nr:hypothetical protein B0H21DRAFT_882382 [Amylocystis lapponica]
MASPSTLIRSHLAGPVRVTRSISNLLSPTPPSPRRSRPTKTELQTKLAPAHIRAWLENAEYPAPFTTTTTSSSPRPVAQLRIMSGGCPPSPIAAFSLPSLTEDLSPPVPSATHSSVQSGLSTFDSQNDEVYVPGAPYGDFRRTPGAPKARLPQDARTPGAPVHYDSRPRLSMHL